MWTYRTTQKSVSDAIASRDWIQSALTFTDVDSAAQAAGEWIAISAVNGHFPAVMMVELSDD